MILNKEKLINNKYFKYFNILLVFFIFYFLVKIILFDKTEFSELELVLGFPFFILLIYFGHKLRVEVFKDLHKI
jgi:hypothetical protein